MERDKCCLSLLYSVSEGLNSFFSSVTQENMPDGKKETVSIREGGREGGREGERGHRERETERMAFVCHVGISTSFHHWYKEKKWLS